MPQFVQNGANEVIVNSEKGKKWFEEISKELTVKELSMGEALQPNLYRATRKPAQYERVQKILSNGTLSDAVWAISSLKGKAKVIVDRFGLHEPLYRIKHKVLKGK